MVLYHITLPEQIPDFLFEELTNTNVAIKRNLRYAYSRVRLNDYTNDSTPIAALSNHFFRNLHGSRQVTTRSLIKMFKPVVEDYVRESQGRPMPLVQPPLRPVELIEEQLQLL